MKKSAFGAGLVCRPQLNTIVPQLVSQQDTDKILLNPLEIYSKDALEYALT